MSEKEVSGNPPEVASLNRRKPENRWQRILRDAEWDQHETVRRWLKFAQRVFDRDDGEPQDKAA